MRFQETPLQGAYVIELEPIRDERGFFARTYCDDEFAKLELNTEWPQENLSYNAARHTLRGMHFNRDHHAEEKIVCCTVGAAYDVIIDLRVDSPTQFTWFGIELTASNRTALLVPRGFAHGFLTLLPDTEIRYRMGAPYHASASAGIRWNDPSVGIEWPAGPSVINERDATYRDIRDRLGEFS